MRSPYLTEQKTIDLFEKFHVLTEAELYSRQEIKYEAYAKALNIEARAMIDIASKQILPVGCPVCGQPGTFRQRGAFRLRGSRHQCAGGDALCGI